MSNSLHLVGPNFFNFAIRVSARSDYARLISSSCRCKGNRRQIRRVNEQPCCPFKQRLSPAAGIEHRRGHYEHKLSRGKRETCEIARNPSPALARARARIHTCIHFAISPSWFERSHQTIPTPVALCVYTRWNWRHPSFRSVAVYLVSRVERGTVLVPIKHTTQTAEFIIFINKFTVYFFFRHDIKSYYKFILII